MSAKNLQNEGMGPLLDSSGSVCAIEVEAQDQTSFWDSSCNKRLPGDR